MLTEPAFLLYVHSKAELTTPHTLGTCVLKTEEQFSCLLLTVVSQEMSCSPSCPSFSYTTTLCHYFSNTHSNIKILLDLSSPHNSAAALLPLTKGF